MQSPIYKIDKSRTTWIGARGRGKWPQWLDQLGPEIPPVDPYASGSKRVFLPIDSVEQESLISTWFFQAFRLSIVGVGGQDTGKMGERILQKGRAEFSQQLFLHPNHKFSIILENRTTALEIHVKSLLTM